MTPKPPPPAAPGPARKAIDRLLADGHPHDRQEILEVAARAVHPGRAYRTGEADRRSHQRRRGHQETTRQRGDRDQAVAAGARRTARAALRKAVMFGAVEQLPDDTYRAVAP